MFSTASSTSFHPKGPTANALTHIFSSDDAWVWMSGNKRKMMRAHARMFATIAWQIMTGHTDLELALQPGMHQCARKRDKSIEPTWSVYAHAASVLDAF
ncbi:hypothetical protein TRAPUB_2646 [Trametes pubescens]|uniref:Uncharacterized protein n=1 Tax=Trametes pubescens TaxID=154538 RepID=A0A1M2VG30_TRAPU|nr:hypothetical protein TRAPUB_2646 [Trametes pubescens]